MLFHTCNHLLMGKKYINLKIVRIVEVVGEIIGKKT